MHELLSRLTGGDRRSIGRSNEVVAAVLSEPSLFDVLFGGLESEDPLIRMRAADALEKITVRHPEWLQPYKEQLIGQVAQSQEQEVRWHVAQMFPRLQTSQKERTALVAILLDYLDEMSKIVKTFAMQALADLAKQDAGLRPEVIRVLEEQTRSGSPAMQSRGRKLLRQLQVSGKIPHRSMHSTQIRRAGVPYYQLHPDPGMNFQLGRKGEARLLLQDQRSSSLTAPRARMRKVQTTHGAQTPFKAKEVS